MAPSLRSQRLQADDGYGDAEADRDHGQRAVDDVEPGRSVLAGHVDQAGDPDEQGPRARGEQENRNAAAHEAVAIASRARWVAAGDALSSGSRTSAVGMRP